MTENQNNLEREVRELMAIALLNKTELPIAIEGKAVYHGKLNIKIYRECFPDGDDYTSLYVLLREINPEFAEHVTNIYRYGKVMLEAADKNDHKLAIESKDEVEKAKKSLVDYLARKTDERV